MNLHFARFHKYCCFQRIHLLNIFLIITQHHKHKPWSALQGKLILFFLFALNQEIGQNLRESGKHLMISEKSYKSNYFFVSRK